ncbi:uncharacterized protein MELLADRAFT_60586 [Melampsora larici-populina 98AG31]|uniref:Uncharacterized protein n=1 Tax=Melampsora larici-populina (strain 98AG31 / pathotype 3-4-7) TaxID=747676 RepID=F4RBM2_MELLP|nr:uncharacterized protein MELLADRAFT_60586 [Melampsora larici-populina 98AG31]EGG10310.1 hypothetical protein MELLADRAFT_60586 [Melampsora larici-populina 98AG31]
MRGSSVQRKLRSSAGGENAPINIDPPKSRNENPSRLKRKQSNVEEDDQEVVIRSKKKNIAEDPGDKSTAEDQAVTTNSKEIDFQIYIILPVTDVQPEPSNVMQGSFTFSVNTKDKEDICTSLALLLMGASTSPVPESGSPERVASTLVMDNPSLEGSSTSRKSSYKRSSEHLPSLEHGTLAYPRPRPTDLSKEHWMRRKSRKGKEKERRESESEYLPEDDEMFEDQHHDPDENENPTKSKGMQDEVASEKVATDEETSKTSLSLQELTRLWKESRAALVKANKRIETLESEFKSLSNFVKTSLANHAEQESSQARGGRTAFMDSLSAHIRHASGSILK